MEKQSAWGFFILSLALLFAMSLDLIRTSELWFVGVEKDAQVVALNHTSWSKHSGQLHHYDITIDKQKLVLSVSSKLSIGSSINVLVHPFEPKNFTTGTKGDSFFDFLSLRYGLGSWRAIIALFGLLMLVSAPFVFFYLILHPEAMH